MIEDPGIDRLRASIGVLTSFMEPINDSTVLRVELVPGSGETVTFFTGDAHADSLEYGGLSFRRR